MAEYTQQHAKSGIHTKLPSLASWPNQYPGYEVTIETEEFTSVCPKTGLPDFGTIRIRYMPRKWCVELKALKLYLNGYRDLGIFQENVVNRVLKDFVAAVKPVWVEVTGTFNIRGGTQTIVEARYPRKRR